MNEILFSVQESSDGGYEASAIHKSIFTDAENMDDLILNIKEAVICHFDEDKRPETIKFMLSKKNISIK